MTDDVFQRLREAMAARVERGELPGLVILVADGEQVRLDAIGATAFEDGQPMRADTVFRIASLTKPVLAAATMMLVDDGVIALDEPVDRLLPELANRRVLARIDGPLDETVPADRPITVEDLLTFRMGYGLIVEPTFDPPYPVITAARELGLVTGPPDPRTPHQPDEWIRRFGTLPLMCQPGERWQYNVGALVLSALVARAAGRSLPELVRTRITAPLGMVDTGFWLPPDQVDRLPAYYATDPQSGVRQRQSLSPPHQWAQPPAFPSGAAGLVATATDYLAFARMLLRGGVAGGTRLLSAESVAAMTTNHLTPHQMAGAGPILGGRGWGYGMSVLTAPPAAGGYGWEGGYGTVWFNHPGRDRVAILLSQTTDVLFNGTMTEFVRLASG